MIIQKTLFPPLVSFEQNRITGPLPENSPIVISNGLGVDSVAMLVRLRQLGIRPDLILFADVGNEKKETYEYLPILREWLTKNGFPEIEVVRYEMKRAKFNFYGTLLGNCIANRSLPSIAFFRHGCSLKWKGAQLCKKVGELFGDTGCYRLIGYDASPRDLARFGRASGKGSTYRPQDVFAYPLVYSGWTREECVYQIGEAGLPLPVKSSCTFCSSMKPDEVLELPKQALIEICIIEANASPYLLKIKGLWHDKRISDFIKDRELLPRFIVEEIWGKWAREERVIPAGQEGIIEDYLAVEVSRYLDCLEGVA